MTNLHKILEEEREEFESLYQKNFVADIDGKIVQVHRNDWITAHDHRILTAIRSEIEEMKYKPTYTEKGEPYVRNAEYLEALTHVQELIDGVLKD